ncbi:hypothetical protein [Spirosoma pollinicola]|uniref:hypothetical protein n=1 Tax=Spirosoma pollinicola TaxID=2057025 RepID=UPI001F0C17A5|nr:hypothetical protein [Spirosoma pollinicola]
MIGLVDDPAQLPADFVSPYPIIPVKEVLTIADLTSLSAKYTPTEFAAACKPLFIAEAFRRFPEEDKLLYADPSIQFLTSLSPIWEQLTIKNTILTPFITAKPMDTRWPDEKFFQNIGLYSSDFLGFCRSAETDRLLVWWDDRVRDRAQIDFCEGLCLDQLWLMHVPVFFTDVAVVRNPGWHVALWNLHERTLLQEGNQLRVSGPDGQDQPLQFINFKGLANPDEGFFTHQNRFQLRDRPEVAALLATYRQHISVYQSSTLVATNPSYGEQLEPVVLRGWRYAVSQSLQGITRFIDRVPIPVIN